MSDHQASLPRLRTIAPVETGDGISAPSGVVDSVELLIDLIGATKLVPLDKLALAGDRARETGSFARSLIDEGIASGEGVARHRAGQFGVPLIDFMTTSIDETAAALVPMRVLERVVAIPYALDGDILRIAVADPANVQGIDELRLA